MDLFAYAIFLQLLKHLFGTLKQFILIWLLLNLPHQRSHSKEIEVVPF